MAANQFMCLLCLGLLVPYALTSPVTDVLMKKHTQLAVLVIIGLDELVTGGALMSGLTGLVGVSALDRYNYACTGFSAMQGRYTTGWCRDWCESFQEPISSETCGEYVCCVPMDEKMVFP